MSPTIGFLACDVHEEISRLIWQGVTSTARKHNLNSIFFAGGALKDPVGYRGQANQLYDMITPERIDGLIILSSSIHFSASREEMVAFIDKFSSFPVVSIEETFPGVTGLVKDDYGGMAQVMSHLVEDHHRRRIVFIQGPSGSVGAKDRFRAYIESLAKYDLPFDPHLVTPIPKSWSYLEGKELFQIFLEESALLPRFDFDAVVAVNDENALAAIHILQSRGIRIPDDVSITGFDDLPMAGAHALPLTTVRSPFTEMGSNAVSLMISKFSGEENIRNIVVPTHLVIRHSCGCLLPTIKEAEPKQLLSSDINAPSLSAAIFSNRKSIASEMVIHIGDDPETNRFARQLLNGFISELDHGTKGLFLSTLDEVLNQNVVKGGRVKDWQRAVTILKDRVFPLIQDTVLRKVADDLLHQARIMVGETSWRHQASKRLNSEEQARRLREIGARLVTSVNLHDLLDTLFIELPQLGITRCYLSIYEWDDKSNEGNARLIMAYDENGRVNISDSPVIRPLDGLHFVSKELLPVEIWSRLGRYSLLVEPLYTPSESLGFILFETTGLEGDREGEIFDALQMIISSSLKTSLLHLEAKTARMEAEKGWELAEARRKDAEEANQLKSRFLSMVSHELRTPLNVIAGLSENILEQRNELLLDDSNSFIRDLEQIHASAQHLDSLIRDVLDLAVSQVGQLKLSTEKLDISECLKPVIEMGGRMAREKGLIWETEISEELPRILYDRIRLRQIFLNLITNAVKFTDKGKISIRIEHLDGKVTFWVKDTGLGIPEEEQANIFEEFHRTKQATARGYGGMGLGLAICQKLVQMGGGDIGVISVGKEDGGSEFYFSLPALKDDLHRNLVIKRDQVLILSYDMEESSILVDRLCKAGFDVQQLCILKNNNWVETVVDIHPGTIILDMNNNVSEAWQLFTILKANSFTSQIPILFRSISQDVQRGAIVDMDYLQKPLANRQLIHALEGKGLIQENIPKTILVVDDEENFLNLNTQMVKNHLPDSRVLRAKNGRDAISVMLNETPDLVLLDLMMPEMDGFQVLENMRRYEQTRCIPVIILTSQNLSESEMLQLNQGVAAVLEKGLFSVEETFDQLEVVLSRNKQLGSEARRIARKTMGFIHENYTRPISRQELADYAGVSPGYLSTLFREETGVTLSSYIERYRIKQARRLLETTELNITEIALSVGFCDSSYFGRIFRREIGVSPLAYKKGDRKLTGN